MKKFSMTWKKLLVLLPGIFFMGFTFYLLVAISGISFEYIGQGRPNESAQTHVVRGSVAMKQTSCGYEEIQPDGTIKRGGACDAGNVLRVNELKIFTGGGALTGEKYFYISNIENIRLGDEIEMRYVSYDEGRGSTNCPSCYVKKAGQSPEEQRLIDQRVHTPAETLSGFTYLVRTELRQFLKFYDDDRAHDWLMRLYIVTGVYLLVVGCAVIYRRRSVFFALLGRVKRVVNTPKVRLILRTLVIIALSVSLLVLMTSWLFSRSGPLHTI